MTYPELIDAYSAYRNAEEKAREHYEPEELAEFLEDMNKAKAAMETAWLKLKPTIGDA